jgi:Ser-tRNA(Ala) deacylase AlaX
VFICVHSAKYNSICNVLSSIGLANTIALIHGVINMTIKKYMETEKTNLISNVTCCLTDEGQHIVHLDETIFHPQGGGQPSDIGSIGSAQVYKVIEKNGFIEHYISEPVDVGPAQTIVNKELRDLHSKLHSIGHLIGNIGEDLGWTPIKAHHWPKECRVEFARGENAIEVSNDTLKTEYKNLIDSRARLIVKDNLHGRRHVSFGSLQAWPCGGTHVLSLEDLPNDIEISVKYKKQKMVVRYDIKSHEGV